MMSVGRFGVPTGLDRRRPEGGFGGTSDDPACPLIFVDSPRNIPSGARGLNEFYSVQDHRRVFLDGDRARQGDPDIQRRTWRARRRHAAIGGGPRGADGRCHAASSEGLLRAAPRRGTATRPKRPSSGDPRTCWSRSTRARRLDRRPRRDDSRLEVSGARRHRPREFRSTCSTRSFPRTANGTATLTDTSTAATATIACCQEVVLGMGGADAAPRARIARPGSIISTKVTRRC